MKYNTHDLKLGLLIDSFLDYRLNPMDFIVFDDKLKRIIKFDISDTDDFLFKIKFFLVVNHKIMGMVIRNEFYFDDETFTLLHNLFSLTYGATIYHIYRYLEENHNVDVSNYKFNLATFQPSSYQMEYDSYRKL